MEQEPIIPTTKQNKKSSITVIILAVILIGTYWYWTSPNKEESSSSNSHVSYEERVKTVEEIERATPVKFLKASGAFDTNFWGNKFIIKGTIENKATVADYKDVEIEVAFYSKTETELSRKNHTFYDFFPAHSKKAFEFTVDRPVDCESLALRVVSAAPK